MLQERHAKPRDGKLRRHRCLADRAPKLAVLVLDWPSEDMPKVFEFQRDDLNAIRISPTQDAVAGDIVGDVFARVIADIDFDFVTFGTTTRYNSGGFHIIDF